MCSMKVKVFSISLIVLSKCIKEIQKSSSFFATLYEPVKGLKVLEATDLESRNAVHKAFRCRY